MKNFGNFGRHWPPRDIRKNPRSMYSRVPQAMAQFVLKRELLSHIMGTTPILEMARAYGLRPRLWLLHLFNMMQDFFGWNGCNVTWWLRSIQLISILSSWMRDDHSNKDNYSSQRSTSPRLQVLVYKSSSPVQSSCSPVQSSLVQSSLVHSSHAHKQCQALCGVLPLPHVRLSSVSSL